MTLVSFPDARHGNETVSTSGLHPVSSELEEVALATQARFHQLVVLLAAMLTEMRPNGSGSLLASSLSPGPGW